MTRKAKFVLILPILSWLIASLFYFHQYFLRTSLSSLGAQVSEAFHLSPIGLSDLASSFYVIFIVMQIFAGILVDRFGAKKTLVAASLICALGSSLFTLANTVFLLYIGRIFMGAGAAFALIGTLTLASHWFDQKRFIIINGLTSSLGLMGAILSEGPLAKLLLHNSWRYAMAGASIIAIIISVLIFIFIKEPKKANIKNNNSNIKDLIKGFKYLTSNIRLWLICFAMGLTYISIDTLAGLWLSPYLMQEYSITIDIAGYFSGMIFIGIAVGSIILSVISSRFTRYLIWITSLCLFMALFFSYALIYGYWRFENLIIICFIYGVLISSIILLVPIIRKEVDPEYIATAFSIAEFFKHLISILSLQVVGLMLGVSLHSHTSRSFVETMLNDVAAYQHALTIAPLGLLLAFMICLFLALHDRKK